MNLINNTFQKCQVENRKAFVAYITAGDPDYDVSLEIIDVLVESGVDILELGVPFSDPLADGETIQLASERAISSGMTANKALKMAEEIRNKHPELPIVLFTYLNPIAYSGDFREFCKRAVTAGISAILPLDLPPEEAAEYREIIDEVNLPVVSLVAPTTPETRVKMLSEYANSFIYYVCREGVTGERQDFAEGVQEKISIIRKHSKLPIVVGFGISTPTHVKTAAATGVDGVVVGSAIVKKIAALKDGNSSIGEIGEFVASLTAAL